MNKIALFMLFGAFVYAMLCQFNAADAYALAHAEPIIVPGDWVAEVTHTPSATVLAADLPRPVKLSRR